MRHLTTLLLLVALAAYPACQDDRAASEAAQTR